MNCLLFKSEPIFKIKIFGFKTYCGEKLPTALLVVTCSCERMYLVFNGIDLASASSPLQQQQKDFLMVWYVTVLLSPTGHKMPGEAKRIVLQDAVAVQQAAMCDS